VIFNAIPENEVLEPLPGELRLFKLDDLARAYVCLHRRGTTVYILNLDYRHYYYRIPLPPAFWKYALRGSPDAAGSCANGLPRRMSPVLLDGILIMSHDQMFVNLWQKRLARNEKQANVERKVAHVVKITATERHCQSCEETDAKCTTFARVELQPGGRREPASDTFPELPASPTWRQVAAALGAALWAMRVRTAGIPQRLTSLGLLQAECALEVWGEVGKRAPIEGWDKPATDVNWGQLTRFFRRIQRSRSTPERILGQCCQRCLERVRYVVTDAMPNRIGWVIFKRDARGDLRPVKVGSAQVPEPIQAQAEMRAANAGAHAALAEEVYETCEGCGWPPIIILAVDADGVRYCLNKGDSGNPGYREQLRNLPAVMISSVRVPG
jgi:hypothetical protein